jgi:hypothetical protein
LFAHTDLQACGKSDTVAVYISLTSNIHFQSVNLSLHLRHTARANRTLETGNMKYTKYSHIIWPIFDVYKSCTPQTLQRTSCGTSLSVVTLSLCSYKGESVATTAQCVGSRCACMFMAPYLPLSYCITFTRQRARPSPSRQVGALVQCMLDAPELTTIKNNDMRHSVDVTYMHRVHAHDRRGCYFKRIACCTKAAVHRDR